MGVFDGEGCISAYMSRHGRWSLTICATLASEPVIDLFRAAWGGGKHKVKKLTVGGLQLFTWHISASTAIPFLEYAAQHALVKRQQAILGLSLAKEMQKYTVGSRKGHRASSGIKLISQEEQATRTAIVLQMRALNGGRSRFAA